MSSNLEKVIENVRCPGCQGLLKPSDHSTPDVELDLLCVQCGASFPVIDGIPRLLSSTLREALLRNGSASAKDQPKVATARSFGFEWTRFPEMYQEWQQTFLDYMQPHSPDFFEGKKVLDAGCGNGRFAYYAAKYGAEVWAIDLGSAVEVARRNTETMRNVRVLQADLHHLPFPPESFDFIYSIGVLHHLPEPEPAFQNLLNFLRPGGAIQIYLYWKPERQPLKSAMLAGVTATRKITTRLPHPLVYALSYPAALAAFGLFVWPYKLLGQVPGLKSLAEKLPMKQYARFPFRVCINDQLDRLSAPIEKRYTRQEVADWLSRAGLEEQVVSANYGWVGTGRKPRRLAAAG